MAVSDNPKQDASHKEQGDIIQDPTRHSNPRSNGPASSPETQEYNEKRALDAGPDGLSREKASQLVSNPLAGLDASALANRGEEYCRASGFTDETDVRAFRLGAQLAADPMAYDKIDGLTDVERAAIRLEIEHKWKANPRMLYAVIVGMSLPESASQLRQTPSSNNV